MKEKHFWRLVSLLPLLLPLFSLLLISIRKGILSSPGPPASIGQVFLLGSLYFGGIFYLVFIIITQIVIWSKPAIWDRRASLIAPFIFLLIFLLGLQIYWVVTSSGTWFDNPRILPIYSLIVIITGYFYVGIAWGSRAIMRTIGILKEEVPQQ
jgi:hypothetical protein